MPWLQFLSLIFRGEDTKLAMVTTTQPQTQNLNISAQRPIIYTTHPPSNLEKRKSKSTQHTTTTLFITYNKQTNFLQDETTTKDSQDSTK